MHACYLKQCAHRKKINFLSFEKICLMNLTEHDRGLKRGTSDQGLNSVYRLIASCLGSILVNVLLKCFDALLFYLLRN